MCTPGYPGCANCRGQPARVSSTLSGGEVDKGKQHITDGKTVRTPTCTTHNPQPTTASALHDLAPLSRPATPPAHGHRGCRGGSHCGTATDRDESVAVDTEAVTPPTPHHETSRP